MTNYTSVAPHLDQEPRFVGGIVIGKDVESRIPEEEVDPRNEIPLVFSNRNRRRLLYCLITTFVLIAALVIGLIIYAFMKA